MSFYKTCIRPALFALDSETAHDVSLGMLEVASIFPPIHSMFSASCMLKDSRLESRYASLEFKNPVGLAAGFDKDAKAISLLSRMGFGFIEVGTVTRVPQAGNPKPRIHRLPEDAALINSMGFPSRGVENLKKRLKRLAGLGHIPPLGINIGKNKETDLEKAAEDYVASFKALAEYAAYVAINVSSPNTPDLRKLQEPAHLTALLKAIQQENTQATPILLKIAPDLTEDELEDVLDVCDQADILGVISCNTTRSRQGLTKECSYDGGMSGRPLYARSIEMVKRIRETMLPEFLIIGVGGISSSDDAIAMMQAGANVIQVYTGFIYQGPGFPKALNAGILAHLKKEGMSSISELIGSGVAA